jgi:hypothetical protein
MERKPSIGSFKGGVDDIHMISMYQITYRLLESTYCIQKQKQNKNPVHIHNTCSLLSLKITQLGNEFTELVAVAASCAVSPLTT